MTEIMTGREAIVSRMTTREAQGPGDQNPWKVADGVNGSKSNSNPGNRNLGKLCSKSGAKNI
jgi:hypothetical protein